MVAATVKERQEAVRLHQAGLSYTEIGRRLGRHEATIRGWLSQPDAGGAGEHPSRAAVARRERFYLLRPPGSQGEWVLLDRAYSHRIVAVWRGGSRVPPPGAVKHLERVQETYPRETAA